MQIKVFDWFINRWLDLLALFIYTKYCLSRSTFLSILHVLNMPRFSLKAQVECMLESYAIAEENAIKALIKDVENQPSDSDSVALDMSDLSLDDSDSDMEIHLDSDSDMDIEEDDRTISEDEDSLSITDSDDDGDEEDTFYREVAQILKSRLAKGVPARIELNKKRSRRYLLKRTHNKPKLVTAQRRVDFLDEIDDDDFREEVRMSKPSFNKLVDMVKVHHLYQYIGGRPQYDIRLQVSVVLERLGTDGNGASHGRLARRCGVGRKLL